MKRAFGLLTLTLCLCAPALPVGAQPRDAITGVPPFVLGMSVADAMQADPSLAPVPAALTNPCPLSTAVGYVTRVEGTLARYPYPADALLCFSDGTLGAIYLTWPSGTFDGDVIRWQQAMAALAAQLTAAYPTAFLRRYAVDEDMGAVIEMGDGQGNLLTMTADPGDDPDVAVTYVSAAYDNAVNGKRLTLTSY